jgi:hypothetical protein
MKCNNKNDNNVIIIIIWYTTDVKFRNAVMFRSKVVSAHAMNERPALQNEGTAPLILDLGTKWT